MLKLEWIARLFSIIAALLIGIFTKDWTADNIFGLYMIISAIYGVFLLFKKYAYPWNLGSLNNLVIEGAELLVLVYLQSASDSPMTVMLFISYIFRISIVYRRSVYIPLASIASLLFILIDFLTVSSNAAINILLWLVFFSFLIWLLTALEDFLKDLDMDMERLSEIIDLNDIIMREINESRDELLLINDELNIWANTDPLTELYNIRYFNNYWDGIYEKFSHIDQADYPILLLMMEVKGHDLYGDVYGHGAVDSLLKDIAFMIQESVEADDIIVRYSDFVFAIIVPGQTEDIAVELFDRFKNRLMDYSLENPGMRNIEIAIGWAVCSDVLEESKEDLLLRASRILRSI